ncbi:MAG: hypothetical protein Q8O76_01790 [Chloroflexota bacterium]|nr:hypothetical protein [Chloroflexota bacterium]
MSETEASRLRQEASRLIAERRGLEKILMEHQRLLRGSLLERPKFCGKPGCKCTRGEPHPPGLYLSRRVGDTARHLFIRAADHERARREALNYKEFRQALRRWRGIDKDLDRIWEALGEAREESYPFE